MYFNYCTHCIHKNIITLPYCAYTCAATAHEITSPGIHSGIARAHHMAHNTDTHCVGHTLLPEQSLLTNAKVCVDACVACGAGEVLVFPVGDVLVGACVAVLLCQAKVNDVDKVAFLPEAHEEVVWFDVTVDEVL